MANVVCGHFAAFRWQSNGSQFLPFRSLKTCKCDATLHDMDKYYRRRHPLRLNSTTTAPKKSILSSVVAIFMKVSFNNEGFDKDRLAQYSFFL